jgi:cAMP-binding proteins - catabolite gene activator and regulatory subunit of cAMP-dependent protein kinases
VIDPLLKRLRMRDDVSDAEEMTLREAIRERRALQAGEVAVREGEQLNVSILLLSGFMARYKDLQDGSRQIIELNVPGDFVDLHGFTLKRLDHNIAAMTACQIGLVTHEALKRIAEDHPHLTRLLWFMTNVDAAIHREWVLSLGRRTAQHRMAHLLCELHARLKAVGAVEADCTFSMSIRQVDLADCLGLTAVHVNRVLHELRERGLVEMQRGQIIVTNPPALRQLANFDDSYLYLERHPA